MAAGGGGRAEAERWMDIAEKLLAKRDLHGSRTFAMRARESDPRMDGSDRILAVVDTLLAGSDEIGGGNAHHHRDWYRILQLARRTQDPRAIASQYSRLGSLLTPTSNPLPFADQAFQLVSDAFSVLSNPSRKSSFDQELSLSEPTQVPLSSYAQPPPPPPPVTAPERRSTRSKPNAPSEGAAESSPSPSESTHPSFWTVCPYCFHMYEYPKAYEECSLRCQNCSRAFHAAPVSPPPLGAARDSYFCCWGFFPLGISDSAYKENGTPRWSPFSAMFPCPAPGIVRPNNVGGRGGVTPINPTPKKRNATAPPNRSVSRVIIEEEDEDFLGYSDPSEDSDDDDWNCTGSRRKKKKAKSGRGKACVPKKRRGRKRKQGTGVEVKGSSGKSDGGGEGEEVLGVGNPMQAGAGLVSELEQGKKEMAPASLSKRQGKVANDLGKLDLNVEFSNEVEEPVAVMNGGTNARNGEEEGIEGIGFFEGLDEFLSSLPILSAVGDEKAKPAE